MEKLHLCMHTNVKAFQQSQQVMYYDAIFALSVNKILLSFSPLSLEPFAWISAYWIGTGWER